MAIKKIEMKPEGVNDYADVLHPETSADIVKIADTGNKFTATNVEGALSELFQNVNDGKTVVASAITTKGVTASSADTFPTLATKIGQITTQSVLSGNAVAAQVLSGRTFYSNNPTSRLTGTIPSKAAATFTPGTSAQTIAAGQYLSGVQTISAVAGLSAANIKNATVVGGVTGTYKGLGNATAAQVLATRTFSTATLTNTTGTMVNRGAVTSTLTTQGGAYTIPVGYHSGTGKVTASFSNLVAGNVKSGVNIGGVVGSLVDGAGMLKYWTGTRPFTAGVAEHDIMKSSIPFDVRFMIITLATSGANVGVVWVKGTPNLSTYHFYNYVKSSTSGYYVYEFLTDRFRFRGTVALTNVPAITIHAFG